MPVERPLDRTDALAITRQAVRDTIGFNDEIRPDDTLAFFGIAPGDIEPLKSRMIGDNGVRDYVYTLNRDFLAAVRPAATVSAVAEIIFSRSIPDMTFDRSLTVIRESAAAALGNDVQQPQPAETLKDIGVSDQELLNRFKHAVVEHPHAGVRVFRHVLPPEALANVTSATVVEGVASIIINETEPLFD